MRFLSLRLLLIVGVLALPGFPRAEDDLSRLLHAVGLQESVEGLETALINAVSALAPVAHTEVAEAITHAATAHFAGDAVAADVEGRLAGKLAPEDVRELLRFFGDGLGRRMIQLEIEANDVKQADRVESEGASLLARLRVEDGERLRLIEQIAATTRAVDGALAVARSFNFGLAIGIGQTVEPPEAPPLDQIDAEIEASRPMVRELVLGWFAYAYRDVEDDALADYASHLREPLLTAFYEEASDAMLRSLMDRSEAFGVDVVQSLAKRRI